MPVFKVPVVVRAECVTVHRVVAPTLTEAEKLAYEKAPEAPFYPVMIDRWIAAESRRPKPNRTVLSEIVAGIGRAKGWVSAFIQIPGLRQPIKEPLELCFDYYGENRKRFQILTHDDEGELQVALRFNKEGKLVEVAVEDINVVMLGGQGVTMLREGRFKTKSEWMKERDGEN